MGLSFKGMYNTVAGPGGIKVRSGKILKIVKVGKFKGEIVQKDGSTKVIVLNKVHFVPDMYCNLFSIIAEMDKGFSVTGRKDTFLMLRKKDMVFKFDRIIKSGAGKLVGFYMTPTDKTTA